MSKCSLTVALLLYSIVSLGQTKLTDFNFSNRQSFSNPRSFFEFNGQLFFIATHDKTGSELWRTDGTAEKCALVKDINLGPGSSIISNFLKFKNKFYFIANDGIYGYELWESDGTASGTKRITSGIQYNVENLVATENHIYFLKVASGTLEVWKSDGTAQGTTLVIGHIPIWNRPANLTAALGKVFFTAQPHGLHETRVWRSDGTEAGTFPITGNIDGNGSGPNGTAHPTQFIEFRGAVYFVCRGGNFGYPLSVGIMKTDGSTQGTVPVKAIHEGTSRLIQYSDVVAHNGQIYFSFFETDYNRFFVWSSDGTTAGTDLVYDYQGSNYFSPSNIGIRNDKLYFTSGNASGGTSVIAYDPATKTSQAIQDVIGRMNPPFYFSRFYDLNKIVSFDNKLFLTAVGEETYPYFALWSSVGSTSFSKIPQLKASELGIFNTRLFFGGQSDNDLELYTSDGTVAGTIPFGNLNPTTAGLGSVSRLYSINDLAVFGVLDSLHGYELWRTDGTKNGTFLLADVRAGEASSFPRSFTRWNNKLYFAASPTSSMGEIYVTDGTAEGTKAVTHFAASGERFKEIFGAGKDYIFLTAERSDGSSYLCSYEPNAKRITEIYDFGQDMTQVKYYAAPNNILYFVVKANELWKSDGTPGGTMKIAEFDFIWALAATGNNIYLMAFTGYQLFLLRNDGTPDGTIILKELSLDIHPAAAWSIFPFNDKVYFVDQDATYGREIWVSEGTPETTFLLKDIYEGPTGSFVTPEFRVHNNILYFRASNSIHGCELWKTDGSSEGTIMVTDILPGAGDSKPNSFASTGGRLYFTAFTPEKGFEIWSTSGDLADTQFELDVLPGETYSNPYGYLHLNGNLIFYATSSSNGLQLWSSAIVTETERTVENDIIVYPNPSTGTFRFSSEKLADSSLKVLNTSGENVYSVPSLSETPEVNLETLPSGLYIFQFKTGNRLISRKVVKH